MIEDIRLTPDELDKLYEDYMLSSQPELVLKAYVANTATDKAIRKVIDIIRLEIKPLTFLQWKEVYGNRPKDIVYACGVGMVVEDIVGALKKLIGEK